MKAVILATNESLHLAPLTDNLPGPMLPLAGKPIMAYTVELLARAGINDIVICLHRMGGSIEAWFGSGRRWGVNISYSLQRDFLGDGGAVKWAQGFVDEPFLFMQGNSLHDLNIEQLIDSHQKSKCQMTIVMSKKGADPDLSIDTQNGLSEQTGAYIFEPELLDFIPHREVFDIQTQFIPLLEEKNINPNYFTQTEYWNPIRSFQDLANAQKTYLISSSEENLKKQLTLQYPTIYGNRFGKSVWTGKNNIIHPSVRIFPPVVIGDNCQVGKDVELGPYTIIGSNSIIDDEASIRQSTIVEKTYIGKLVNVEEKIVNRNLIIDVATGQSTYVTDTFLIGEASPPMINNHIRMLLDKTLAIFMVFILSPFLILISLFLFITTGKIFKVIERIGILPSDMADGDVISPSRIKLKHFNTYKRDGNPSMLTAWIEKSSLHRLPELFGVISGRLSFVGVKPLLPEEAGQLNEEWQYQRYNFCAGFTGLWYTENSGDKDEASLIHDIYYVAVRNLKEDLRILIKTPARWAKNLLDS
jgi:NDP-sugar pyrophosphorylase family protein